jgi:hypothetical protein
MKVLLSLIQIACCAAFISSSAQMTPKRDPNFVGIVLGSRQAVIQNASVLVEGSGRKWSLASDEFGEFKVELPDGTYIFTIDKTAFKKLIVLDLVISSHATMRHQFQLERCDGCLQIETGPDEPGPLETRTDLLASSITPRHQGSAQEFLPSPPSDRGLIYMLDDQNRLVPLPFEPGRTPLHAEQIARSTQVSYIELKGEHATTVFKTATPRVFLFTYQRPGVHPPFLVWLTPHKGARRVTAIAQRGLSGFAISSEEIIKPTVRGLVKDGDLVFMEVRPRVSLMPGEYAIIGDDLARIATFRVIVTAK